MDIDIRPITPEEGDAFRAAMGESFGFDPREENAERFQRSMEFDRSFGAFEGGDLVGTGGAFSFEMTTPGSVAATAGTTMISVLPTHRRRGVLRAMMRHHLDEVADRADPLAALWASESSIYGRFGYGRSVYRHNLTIDTRHAAFNREPDEPGRVRLEAADQVHDALTEVYEAARPQRPGLLSRTEGWWRDQRLHDPDDSREGATKFRYAVYREDGRPLGYAQYRVKSKWTDFFAEGTVQISELFAVTPAADSALWRYLLDIDLVTGVEAWNRPVDDALPWLLTDPRRARYHLWDSLWVRLVDVAAALESRRYRVDGRLVFEVTDDFCPRNQGRFVLEGGPAGATCAATEASPDLSLDIQDLGAIYMGGNRAHTLAAAGRIGGKTEAIALASTMFDWEPQPWCPEIF